MNRRQLIAGMGTVAIGAIAGCSGGGESGSSTSANQFDISIEEEYVVANLEEESEISSIQVLGPGGSEVGSGSVSGSATRVEIIPTGFADVGFNDPLTTYIDETISFVALNESEEEIDRLNYQYSPEIVLNNVMVEEEVVQIDVKNNGNGPAQINPNIISDEHYQIPLAEIQGAEINRIDTKLPISQEYETNAQVGARMSDTESTSFFFNANPVVVPENENVSLDKDISSQASSTTLRENFDWFTAIENTYQRIRSDDVVIEPIDETVTIPAEIRFEVTGREQQKSQGIEFSVEGYDTSLASESTILYEPRDIEASITEGT